MAIRQNTPIGAAFITIVVIFIIISLNCVKNLPTVSALSFNCAKIRPIKRANTIIWSIFPSANEFIGLVGIIFNITSETAVLSAIVVSAISIVDKSRPKPGLSNFPIPMERVIAMAVVAI